MEQLLVISWLAVDFAVAGWHMAYIKEVVIHHFPSKRRQPIFRQSIHTRNLLWFAWQRRRWTYAVQLTMRALANGLTDLRALRGLALAAAGLPWCLQQRRVLPKDIEELLDLLESAGPA